MQAGDEAATGGNPPRSTPAGSGATAANDPAHHANEPGMGQSDTNYEGPIMRVFRIAIPAADIERSRAFYEAVLGFGADDTVPSRLYFHCGGVIVALIDWAIESQESFQPMPDYVYFATGELDRAHERAVAAGASEMTPVEHQPWGERSFYCQDPDGNRLCFVDETTLFLGRGAAWS
jgi:predicted enzyme related to lactoylglutathione lyase